MSNIIIESDRNSVCMADDVSPHNVFSEFSEDTKMRELLSELIKIHSIASTWAVWAGKYNNYKCIKDRKGNWLTDKEMTIKDFFKDIDKYVFFDSEFFGLKCKK